MNCYAPAVTNHVMWACPRPPCIKKAEGKTTMAQGAWVKAGWKLEEHPLDHFVGGLEGQDTSDLGIPKTLMKSQPLQRCSAGWGQT